MSLKANFENHPVVWGLSLIVMGFIAGFGARPYVLSVPAAVPAPTKELNCAVDGLSSLEDAHSKELAMLNSQVMQLEAKASDHTLIRSYQEKYSEAATRIRSDIERSNRTYLAAIDSLSKKCK